jgi:hypothetical protein
VTGGVARTGVAVVALLARRRVIEAARRRVARIVRAERVVVAIDGRGFAGSGVTGAGVEVVLTDAVFEIVMPLSMQSWT